MATAKKSNPGLWETVKKEFMESDKGGDCGQWSARKAQLAVQEYKRRGGEYEDDGPDREDTDLNTWTEADWGTKSGDKSASTGERYLPKVVRMLLTEDEYRRSTKKKKTDSIDGDEQFSDQPADVREKVAKIKAKGPTKAMLEERAADLDIAGRSSMNKDELLKAIEKATDDNGRRKEATAGLGDMSKAELYEQARNAGVEGRSMMTKRQLVKALSN